jgi:hypothetical protein
MTPDPKIQAHHRAHRDPGGRARGGLRFLVIRPDLADLPKDVGDPLRVLGASAVRRELVERRGGAGTGSDPAEQEFDSHPIFMLSGRRRGSHPHVRTLRTLRTLHHDSSVVDSLGPEVDSVHRNFASYRNRKRPDLDLRPRRRV